MALTTEQVQTIRATVPVLQAHGNDITTHFYDVLLKEHPALNNVFNQANQQNNAQPQALAGALYAYASHIDDLGVLAPAVEKICQKHASLYIRPEQYDVVGEYLLRAMKEVLGEACTQGVLDAWGAAYWQLAKLMIKREEDIYSEAAGWTDWREFRIDRKEKESEEITSFYLKPVDGKELPVFLPGQYISILTEVPTFGYVQSRQYSLSDAPNPDYYRVSIKRESGLNARAANAQAHPGFVSNVMHDERKVGDVVKVSHPAGEFFCHPEQDLGGGTPIVLISAGVGLTPMVSILNTATQKKTEQKVSFIHGARSTSVQAFGNHVKDVVAKHPNVTASIFIKNPAAGTDQEGVDYHHASRVNLGRLGDELYLDDKTTKYYVCGPQSFMDDTRNDLVGRGVSEDRIKMELFGTGGIPTATAGATSSAPVSGKL